MIIIGSMVILKYSYQDFRNEASIVLGNVH